MDPVDLTPFVQDRRRALETAACTERLTRERRLRHVAAGYLRGLADRLDPIPRAAGPLTPRPAPAKSRTV